MLRRLCLVSAVTLVCAISACDKNGKKTAESESGKASEQTEQAQSDEKSDDSPQKDEKSSSDSSGESDGETGDLDPALLNPEKADEKAPETFEVKFQTTEGDFVVKVHRDWSPKGADRLYNLVNIGFYEDVAFFRAIDDFMIQFGLKGVPKVDKAWSDANIDDEPVEKSNKRGFVTFAKTKKPDSRSTQLFINLADNSRLDNQGFAPVGKVVEGMNTVESIHTGYKGKPSQARIKREGNEYLEEKFPKLDWIESAEIVEK